MRTHNKVGQCFAGPAQVRRELRKAAPRRKCGNRGLGRIWSWGGVEAGLGRLRVTGENVWGKMNSKYEVSVLRSRIFSTIRVSSRPEVKSDKAQPLGHPEKMLTLSQNTSPALC